jgi:hypothetical protein
MAKQTGPNFFTGRQGDLFGYRMAAGHYVRIISSLTSKRVKKDPAFGLTMHYAALLAKASKIASAIYRLLPKQQHGFYRKLTGMAMQLLKQGKTMEEVSRQLYNDFIPPASSIEVTKRKPVSSTIFPDELLNLLFSKFPDEMEREPVVPDHAPP